MEENIELKSLIIDESNYQTTFTKKFLRRKQYIPVNLNSINAFIPGTVRDIYIQEGQKVSKGTPLLMLEAMKMKNIINAHLDGVIKTVAVKKGQIVTKSQLLIEFE